MCDTAVVYDSVATHDSNADNSLCFCLVVEPDASECVCGGRGKCARVLPGLEELQVRRRHQTPPHPPQKPQDARSHPPSFFLFSIMFCTSILSTEALLLVAFAVLYHAS
eukprot:233358-Rhodomonas_salina.1